jgi:hypothetical protein
VTFAVKQKSACSSSIGEPATGEIAMCSSSTMHVSRLIRQAVGRLLLERR